VARKLVSLVLTMAVIASCSDAAVDAPQTPSDGSATLSVVTTKSSYTASEALVSSTGVRGTITNTSDRTVYARMGDAFNSAVEQDPVYVASGSDASLERANGTAWSGVEGALLIEGIREIELRPGRSYSFIAHTAALAQAGSYRITVAFRASAGASQPSGRASSATFEIR
jgi:hypothetical protein